MSIETTGFQDVPLVLNATVSNKTYQRILTQLAKAVERNSKQRIRSQTDLSGAQWTPRKDGRRKKMLVKIGQAIRTVSVSDSEAVIGFTNPIVGRIAKEQQEGFIKPISEFKRRLPFNRVLTDKPATLKQAKALLDAGFKIRRSGGGFKTPTKQWITENLSIAQAGLVLRSIGTITETWILPARSFLGVTADERATIEAEIRDDVQRQVNHAIG